MYPINYEADPQLEGRNRLTSFFRYFVAIPWQIVIALYGIAAFFAAVVAWFTILFTGKLPEGFFSPMRSAQAYLTRAGGYFLLITEDWPPFSYEESGGAPAGQISTEAASREPQA